MSAAPGKRICLTPALAGVGGMVSFQARLAAGLAARGFEVTSDLDDGPFAAVLVIGGTRRIGALWRFRRGGTRIVQRLDGMNWLHRRRSTGLRHYLRSEYGNWMLAFIRRRLADGVIYQSRFARRWWENRRGAARVPGCEIYNAVDLGEFSPRDSTLPAGRVRLLMVEGSLMGGYELGLESGVALAVELSRALLAQTSPASSAPLRPSPAAHSHCGEHGRQRMHPFADWPVELAVAGRVRDGVRARWEAWLDVHAAGASVNIRWEGLVPQERIPDLDRSAHLFFSADINAACPNAAIEAMACGAPVVGFATGALPELLAEQGGRLASYGGDPWRLDPPDIPGLAGAALAVLQDLPAYRAGARRRAEAAFDVHKMVDAYLGFLLEA